MKLLILYSISILILLLIVALTVTELTLYLLSLGKVDADLGGKLSDTSIRTYKKLKYEGLK